MSYEWTPSDIAGAQADFNRRQSIGDYGCKDRDHLAIAIVRPGELAPYPFQSGRQDPILERVPLRSAPGLRARTGT